MAATRPIGELREAAKKLILEKLSRMTIAQASRDLGISRQAIYGFKKGEYCPSLALIERACKVWGLEFNIRGFDNEMTVNKESFVRHEISAVNRPPQQLTMEHLWRQLENRPVTVVCTKRSDQALEMTLRISIPA
jgi:DNA-binding XRE family transcriptional regulator